MNLHYQIEETLILMFCYFKAYIKIAKLNNVKLIFILDSYRFYYLSNICYKFI